MNQYSFNLILPCPEAHFKSKQPALARLGFEALTFQDMLQRTLQSPLFSFTGMSAIMQVLDRAIPPVGPSCAAGSAFYKERILEGTQEQHI